MFGEVPLSQALRRSAACAGDDIWISGSLGDARLALAARLAELELDAPSMQQADARLQRPTPRVLLGLALRSIAHAAIDISDGLCGDLGHILAQSRVGASIDIDAVPAGAALQGESLERRRHYTLAGGDDYELCFTAPASARHDVLAAANAAATPVTRIGVIEAASGLRLLDADGHPVKLFLHSFDHFST